MVDPQVAWDKLSNFETAKEIREYFQTEGIKGVVGAATQCPIATWLLEVTEAPMVTVASGIKVWIRYPNMSVDPDFQFNHTPATHEFVEAFDHRCYRELEEKEEGVSYESK